MLAIRRPEVMVRKRINHGVDIFKLMAVAEELVIPMIKTPPRGDRDSLVFGLRRCLFLVFVICPESQ